MKTKSTCTRFDARDVWRAFHKGARQSRAGNRVNDYFTLNGERYAMDFSPEHGARNGWYQYDTSQDAWYCGSWANPELLVVVSYAEGDIAVTHCQDRAGFVAELESMDAWNAQRGDNTQPGGRYGIDDFDGCFIERLAAD